MSNHASTHHNFVKEHVELQTIRIVYCATTDMTADILTKLLRRIVFEKYSLVLDMESTHTVKADRVARRSVDKGARRM